MNDEKRGRLILAGTPIGDVADASPRLRATLAEADVIAAEDTRRFRDLLQRLGARTDAHVVSYFEGNETLRTEPLLARLRDGATVVVVTDAGMPAVSDPGHRLVAAAVAAGIDVTAVPGPSAVLTALALSGLPSDRFCFEGFVPRKAGERSRHLAGLAAERRTMVFFEAPHRLAEFLADAAAAFGAGRRAAVCRELTKTYEEIRRDTLGELATWATGHARGEITVVVAGAAEELLDLPAAAALALERIDAGERLGEAVAEVARAHGLSRKELYQATLTARDAARGAGQTRKDHP